MKRYYTIVCLLIMLCITGCKNEVEEIYDISSTQRVTERMESIAEILQKAENGWQVAYFPSPNLSYGGYNLLMKFSGDGRVKMASEMFMDHYDESSYELYQSAGVVLSFNDYNTILSYFTSPINPLGIGNIGKGMEGEMEFRVMSCSPERIELMGKKYSKRVIMTPLSADKDWKAYMESLQQRVAEMNFKVMSYGDGKKLNIIDRNLVVEELKDGKPYVNKYPFIPTFNGLSLYETVNIAGKEIKELKYDSAHPDELIAENGFVLKGETLTAAEILNNANWTIVNYSDDMKSLYNKVKLQCRVRLAKYSLSFGQITYEKGIRTVFNMGSNKAVVKIETTPGMNDQMVVIKTKMTFKDIDPTFFTLTSNVRSFPEFLKKLSGAFKVTVDNPMKPTKIKMQAFLNPKIWFELVEI